MMTEADIHVPVAKYVDRRADRGLERRDGGILGDHARDPPWLRARHGTEPHSMSITRSRDQRRRAVDLALLGLVTTAVTWPTWVDRPQSQLDPSWVTGLHLAWQSRLTHGADITFSYGPLGFAVFPMGLDRSAMVISLVAITALATVFALLTYRLLLTRTGHHIGSLLGTVILALFCGSFGSHVDLVLVAMAATAVSLLVRPPARPTFWLVGAGALAAVLLVIKVSNGSVAVGVAVVYALCQPRTLRSVAITVGSFVGTLVASWGLLGQRFGALPGWLRQIYESNSAHAWAMGIEEQGRAWEYLVVLGVATAALALGVRRRRQVLAHFPTRLHLLSAVAIVGATSLFFFKQGFTRHDHHSLAFFVALLYVVVISSAPRPHVGWRWSVAWSWMVLVVVTLAASGTPLPDAFDPSTSAARLARHIDAFVDRDSRMATLHLARQEAAAEYQLPVALLERLDGRSVHVDPWETTLVWTYDLDWNPALVFQRHLAYSVHLDRLTADGLSASRGPDAILRRAVRPIDGRDDLLEAPLTITAMLCHFAPTEQTDEWQVLERTGSRCSDPVPHGGPVRARKGHVIPVPDIDPDRQILLVAIDFHPGRWDRLRAVVHKAPPHMAEIDGNEVRILPRVSTSPGPLYVPPSSGWSEPFRVRAEPPDTLMLDRSASVRFYVATIDG